MGNLRQPSVAAKIERRGVCLPSVMVLKEKGEERGRRTRREGVKAERGNFVKEVLAENPRSRDMDPTN